MLKSLKIFILSVTCSFFLLPLPVGLATNREQVSEHTDPQELLAAYGQYVYEREACASCHSMTVGPGDLVSLDGLGGKYPDSWHLEHLFLPEIVSPGSEMPGFPDLFQQKLDYAKLLDFARLSAKPYSPVDSALLVNMTRKRLEDDYNALKPDFSGSLERNSEVLALVCFLQQIPASPEKRIGDSLTSLAFMAEQQKLDQAWQDGPDGLISLAGSANPAHIMTGHVLFQSNCTPCHGEQGAGGVGPNLTDNYWLHGGQIKKMLASVQYGYPEKGMPSWGYMLKPEEVACVVAYVRSIQGTVRQGGKEPQGKKE